MHIKKVKGRLAGSSALQLLDSLLCPTPNSSSSSPIHLQRRHRTKRCESPLLAKEGTFSSKEFRYQPVIHRN
jgi:hypothetical protein